MLQIARKFHAKFQLSSFFPDGLRKYFDHFSRKFQNFLLKISKISNFENQIPGRASQKTYFTKIEAI
jgi:hypothetical protein